MHNSQGKIHNFGYFSVATEKFRITVGENSVLQKTSNCIASLKCILEIIFLKNNFDLNCELINPQKIKNGEHCSPLQKNY